LEAENPRTEDSPLRGDRPQMNQPSDPDGKGPKSSIGIHSEKRIRVDPCKSLSYRSGEKGGKGIGMEHGAEGGSRE
jgi:hypothetical protein